MSKLIKAKIDVTKIQKALLFVGKKGTYLDLNIWINDKPDNYGNEISIQQQTKKGDPTLYIGEGKFYVKKEAEPGIVAKDEFQGGKKQTGPMSDINDLPGANITDLTTAQPTGINDDDLPF